LLTHNFIEHLGTCERVSVRISASRRIFCF